MENQPDLPPTGSVEDPKYARRGYLRNLLYCSLFFVPYVWLLPNPSPSLWGLSLTEPGINLLLLTLWTTGFLRLTRQRISHLLRVFLFIVALVLILTIPTALLVQAGRRIFWSNNWILLPVMGAIGLALYNIALSEFTKQGEALHLTLRRAWRRELTDTVMLMSAGIFLLASFILTIMLASVAPEAAGAFVGDYIASKSRFGDIQVPFSAPFLIFVSVYISLLLRSLFTKAETKSKPKAEIRGE